MARAALVLAIGGVIAILIAFVLLIVSSCTS